MKLSELKALRAKASQETDDEVELVEVEFEEDDDEEHSVLFEEDDFIDALDLLETCRKRMRLLLLYGLFVDQQRQITEKLIDDLGNFLEYFITTDPNWGKDIIEVEASKENV
jgi:hypothetical protein